MKVATESKSNEDIWMKPLEFDLPKGLIGFPDVTKYELLANSEELPFMWIRSKERRELGFVVIEPSHLMSDYEIELSDGTVSELGIQEASELIVLNIVTIKEGESLDNATVNLIGPIALNKNTLQGCQVIVSNYQKYSARHPVMASSAVG